VIPNTIDADLAGLRSDSKTIREAYGIPAATKLIAYFGGASRIKGYSRFLEIIEHVTATRDDVAFVFAGPFHKEFTSAWGVGTTQSGRAETQHLFEFVRRKGVADAVRIIGEVRNVLEIMATSDLVVVPNAFPHFSRTILESFYCAVPVLATDDRFNRDMIETGRSGLLADYANLAEWLTNAHSVLDDPQRARELAGNGRKIYETRFDPLTVMSRISEMFEAVHHEHAAASSRRAS
jgi:glycosyltransferase involved in cell wall biosynthesis